MNQGNHHSLLYRSTLTLLFLVLFTICMYYAKGILIPITVAALLSMLLLPIVRKLEAWKLGKFFSIIFSLIVVIIVIGVIIYILTAQVISFSSDLPIIQENLDRKFEDVQAWVTSITGIGADEQLIYLEQATSSFFGAAQSMATNILIATGGTIVFVGLLLVLMFFFLYYRHRIRNFLLHLIPKEEHINTKRIVADVSLVTQKYLSGVFIVMSILSVLNSIVFMLVGVPHPIFFGVLASILNIIPYVGVWIGTLLPMVMLAITQDSLLPLLLIIIGVWITQQIDNNFLTPTITGSQVSINPLATILILIVGGILWGVAGMVLFIPLLGVAKIIFDNVEGLKPLGYLVGEDAPSKPSRVMRMIHKMRRRKK